MTYFRKLWTWFDQGLNVIFLAGYPDETLSARFYRMANSKKITWPMKIVNWMFFWQKNHCFSAYMNECKRKQMPAEYRDK